MSPLPALRKRTLACPRRVVGALAFVWLAVIVQPCAMAFAGSPAADCVHCPPAAHGPDPDARDHGAGHAGHDGTAMHADAAVDAGEQAGCAGGVGDCYVLRDDPFEGRSVQPKVKDGPLELPLFAALVSAPLVSLDMAGRAPVQRMPGAAPGASPPLSVLYCVYLK